MTLARLTSWLGKRASARGVQPAVQRGGLVRAPHRVSGSRGRWLVRGVIAALGFLNAGVAWAASRFPPPEFESNYTMPNLTTPAGRAGWLEYLDVGVLAIALGIATWLALKKRSRAGVIGLSFASLLYFGFYREGCICAIGSPQNVAYALFQPGYAIPLTALAFFVLPLLVALFAGRSFCAGVCPHGAIQDLMLIKPVKVPPWLEQGLGLLPYFYLGTGVLLAATGSTFLFCRYDPFVPIFRLSGSATMLIAGGAFLVLSMFVGRPYCRFLCPYGALLKLSSIFSKWRVRTTPDYCTQCRLCEHSCPFGALRTPSAGKPEPKVLSWERKRLAGLLLLAPVLVLTFGWVGSILSRPASLLHPTVALAHKHLEQQRARVEYAPQSPEALELQRAQANRKNLLTNAAHLRQQFNRGGWLLGGWMGLVLATQLVSLSVRRHRTDYEPDRGACFSCARCFEFCPNERVRRGLLPAEAVALVPHGGALTATPDRTQTTEHRAPG